MTRAALTVRALIAVGVVALSGFIALTDTPVLGLDLRGGTQIVLETQDSKNSNVQANAETTDRALAVMRERVDALGVSEPTLVRSGETRIIIELPGVQDPREARKAIGQQAQLSFHAVQGIAPGRGSVEDQQAQPTDPLVLPDETGQRLKLAPAALTGGDVAGASALLETGTWNVSVDFSGAGGDAWADLTAKAACAPAGAPERRVAIVLDQRIISSPQIDPSVACDVGIVGGQTLITGNFTQAGADRLAVLIEGGALPVPVKVISQSTIGPTLGDEAIDASAQAAVIGIILTGLFIIAAYRVMGAMATIALACYAVISYAALIAVGATLTLPGLAGFVLAIGIAIDANVLVFERAREETSTGARGLRRSLTTGYEKAWSAILDSNVTTLLAAGLLFFLATGPVQGFGVTLSIGVLASMVSALVIARVLTEWAASRRFLVNHPDISGVNRTGRVREWLTRANPDIMGRRNLWLAVSGVAVILAVAGVGVRGLELGVDFTGGRQIEYSTTPPIDADSARAAVADAGYPEAVVQRVDDNQISVRVGTISNDEQVAIQQSLEDVGGGEVVKEQDNLIGPSLGEELRNKALLAFAVALAAQMIYLAIRFRWTFSVSAVLAMMHDVLLVVGIFAWLGKPIDSTFLAAALTIIGLSVNDTVVVFDRIREQWKASPNTPFPRVANTAALQTVPRTVNTGMGAMFILAALAVLGGSSLTDFAVALLLGLLIGTYSSVFTATPLAAFFQSRAKSGAIPPGEKKERKPVSPWDRGGRNAADDSGAVV
ncbi:MAG: protein translocase subunit SecD [Nocardioidaceae bacterium]